MKKTRLSKKSAKLLKQGCDDVKAGRVSPVPPEVTELTEARVRELIAEEMAKLPKCIPVVPSEPCPSPFVPPPVPFPPSVVAYACGFPQVTVLYMAQTYVPTPDWTYATITTTPPPKGGK
jgi:hypothetical protein